MDLFFYILHFFVTNTKYWCYYTGGLEKAFKNVDCIIIPTCPGLPWRIGESMALEEVYSYDALTIPANLAEICAISIPAGKINGIPVGLQVFCGKGQESKMFSIAKQIESLK